jgi:hypothetical protein
MKILRVVGRGIGLEMLWAILIMFSAYLLCQRFLGQKLAGWTILEELIVELAFLTPLLKYLYPR